MKYARLFSDNQKEKTELVCALGCTRLETFNEANTRAVEKNYEEGSPLNGYISSKKDCSDIEVT